MIVRQAAAVAGMAFILGAAPAHAGPCTDRIYQTDLDVAKLLDSAAAQGRPAPQSAFATMHRQPTPGSIASAEQQAGDLPARRRRRSPNRWMRRATLMTRAIAPAVRKR